MNRRLLFRLLTLALLLAVGGCTLRINDSLRVGILVFPGYLFAYLPRQLGYFDDADIELVLYHTHGALMQAYNSGGIDVAATTLISALQNTRISPDNRIIMVIDESAGTDALLVQPGIKSLAELRGKVIGYEHTPLGAYVLSRVLKIAGLERSDIRTVSVDIPNSVEVFRTRSVDAIITYDPYQEAILKLGGWKLFSSAMIPGEIIDVLLAREGTIDKKEQAIRVFILGWHRALKEFNANPGQYSDFLPFRMINTGADYMASLGGINFIGHQENKYLLTGPLPPLAESIEEHIAVMIEAEMDVPQVDPDNIINDRFFSGPGQ